MLRLSRDNMPPYIDFIMGKRVGSLFPILTVLCYVGPQMCYRGEVLPIGMHRYTNPEAPIKTKQKGQFECVVGFSYRTTGIATTPIVQAPTFVCGQYM